MKTTIIFLLSTLIFSFSVKSQSIDSALINFNKKAPQEKVYVQFDNSKYTPGQTIWYKAYLMSGSQTSTISKNFYIDWYDNDGKLISSQVTPVIYSYAAANFKVPSDFNGNSIHAVAYTRWMRNFDSTYFFQQQFQIVSNKNIIEHKDVVIKSSTIQFLPESGSFISNKLNVIAFKAINGLGLPENINGVIKNSIGDTVVTFKTTHNGMGKLQFVPLMGEVYSAIWKDATGIIHKNSLPLSEEDGVNLIIEPGRSNRIFHIQRTRLAPETMKQLTLVGQMNGSLLFMSKLNLSDKESITSSLPLNKILSGILQLTVFDSNDKPLCERVVFVKNEDYKLNTIVNIDTLNTLKRGKNIIEIVLKDTTYTNLSLAITDANTNEILENNIVSHLLLNGELSGNVYKPNYYFSSNADSLINHLDLVMMTNGWRRYNWKNILSDESPKFKYGLDSAYQSINGVILNYENRKNKKPETINLIFVSKDSSNNMITLPILENGTFSSKNAILYDTVKIYYQLNGTTSITNNNLIIQNDLLKPNLDIIKNNLNHFNDTSGYSKLQYIIRQQASIDSVNKYNTLKEVTVFTKQKTRIQELEKRYTAGIFSGEAAASFDMNTLQNAAHNASIYDFLTGKVPGLLFTNAGGAQEGQVGVYRGGRPAFYLNENPVDEDAIDQINMIDVAYVKVFNPPFMSGANMSLGRSKVHESSGAIAIYTKKAEDLNSINNKFTSNGLGFKLNAGYTPRKEFYSPNYAEKEQSSNSKDIRTTLLWNPWISLDKTNQKIKIIYYNNDITNSFRLVLEGMDNMGKLVSINKLLK